MNQFGRFSGAFPPAIKNLLLANGVVFLLGMINPSLGSFLTYHFAVSAEGVFGQFKIWQLVSYMFLHADFFHILFNMFILWMFGIELEHEWGTKEFLKYYFVTGISAGIFSLIFSGAPTVGASGAVYGIMIAYALRYPDRMVYIYFLFPVKVKYMMGFLTLVSLFNSFGSGDNIAHVAHLGGIVVGAVYVKWWTIYYKLKSVFDGGAKKSDPGMKYHSGGTTKSANDIEYYRKKLDEILDKINKVGFLNLTEDEKRKLDEYSRYIREHDEKNIH